MRRFHPSILLSASYSESSSSQTSTQIDKSVNTQSGDVTSLADNNLTVNNGGSVTVISKDPEAAYRAIDAIKATTIDLVDTITSTAGEITAGSNNIAKQVADSQANFVSVASGQKYVLYAVAGVAALVLLPALLRTK